MKKEKKRINRAFYFFLVVMTARLLIGGESKVGIILNLLFLPVLIILIAEVIRYRNLRKK